MRRGGGVGNSSSLRLHDHTGLQRFFSISATLNPYVVASGGSVSTSYLSASSRSSSLDSPVTCVEETEILVYLLVDVWWGDGEYLFVV